MTLKIKISEVIIKFFDLANFFDIKSYNTRFLSDRLCKYYMKIKLKLNQVEIYFVKRNTVSH